MLGSSNKSVPVAWPLIAIIRPMIPGSPVTGLCWARLLASPRCTFGPQLTCAGCAVFRMRPCRRGSFPKFVFRSCLEYQECLTKSQQTNGISNPSAYFHNVVGNMCQVCRCPGAGAAGAMNLFVNGI